MAGYLEALNPLAWEATDKAVAGVIDEDHTKWNARTKNVLFELLLKKTLLMCIARKPLMKFGKSLRPSMLGLRNSVKRNTKCLKRNSMSSKCFLVN